VNFIADTGFIVSRWAKQKARREWASRCWEKAALPMLTSAANLQEAGWLLENSEIILRMVRDGDLAPVLDFEKESFRLHELAEQYQPRMDIADAAIVRLSELYPHHTILTVDRTDFSVYRRNQTQALPCDFGPAIWNSCATG
jgi:predicted nucleic acid-binding protein